jgi:hypothetical protein
LSRFPFQINSKISLFNAVIVSLLGEGSDKNKWFNFGITNVLIRFHRLHIPIKSSEYSGGFFLIHIFFLLELICSNLEMI